MKAAGPNLLGCYAVARPAVALIDTDNDGTVDAIDNCVDRVNADQRDSNGDGIGNACDSAHVQDPGTPIFRASGAHRVSEPDGSPCRDAAS